MNCHKELSVVDVSLVDTRFSGDSDCGQEAAQKKEPPGVLQEVRDWPHAPSLQLQRVMPWPASVVW